MRYSANHTRLGAHVSIAGGLHKALSRGEELGCDVIQVFTKNATQWRSRAIGREEVALFKAEVERTGIHVIAHDSYLINLGSPDGGLRRRSVAALTDETERAELLGLDQIVVHPGAHKGSGVNAGIRRIAGSISETLKRTSGSAVKILLENTAGQGTALGHTFDQIGRIIDMTVAPERLRMCLDTCHAFAAGYDLASAAGYEEAVDELDEAVGLDLVEALHLNDCLQGFDSRVDRHEHIGMGTIGADCFRRLMNDVRFEDRPKLIETPKELNGREMDPVNLRRLRAMIEAAPEGLVRALDSTR